MIPVAAVVGVVFVIAAGNLLGEHVSRIGVLMDDQGQLVLVYASGCETRWATSIELHPLEDGTGSSWHARSTSESGETLAEQVRVGSPPVGFEEVVSWDGLGSLSTDAKYVVKIRQDARWRFWYDELPVEGVAFELDDLRDGVVMTSWYGPLDRARFDTLVGCSRR